MTAMHVTVRRIIAGTGAWSIHDHNTRIGSVSGTPTLGYTWATSTGSHGVTAEPTLGEAVDALVAFVRAHKQVA